ncbi:type III-B CRISPR-associated protein Cas10/Cmr2 [Pokkaliibacter sp. MBI-7]|uniref:type III-B CRISPR-associated protein Cas10/Cmr2 n=1 Tax=Pokkaliibacter sp. MBI-7 TaxID=3040600 RepID=UPI00244A98F6|nr:type III-B CRISPR-associated protein Cas10/Cmr2 [Pokkaliibacter sp. MBI-7]MDH2431440.1 type III-B CRISPR-associated protein Cas10/Cmr2 [Pokkaliibacter sp. MBI-7]
MTTDNTLWSVKRAVWASDPVISALLGAPAAPSPLHQSLIDKARQWAGSAEVPQGLPDEDPLWMFQPGPPFEWQHPLDSETTTLLTAGTASDQRAVAAELNALLLEKDDKQRALALWRFLPSLTEQISKCSPELAALWPRLPLHRQVPGYNRWAHLDLTCALASAFTLDDEHNPALLTLSFGPVQSFIAAARTSSDLWAGSHLLSTMVWEGLKVIVSHCGPEAVIFPHLRGIPLCDLWLTEQGIEAALFDGEHWRHRQSDANSLFSAALPNKIVALVPHSKAQQLAEQIQQVVRDWVQTTATACFENLLSYVGEEKASGQYGYQQLQQQLEHFPDISWAVVPFSPLVTAQGGSLNTDELNAALAPANTENFITPRLLQPGADGRYQPTPATCYPALYRLLDQLGSEAKSLRDFTPHDAHGYRCSLTGESEWLSAATSREAATDELGTAPKKRIDTLWAEAVKKGRRYGLKKGEHLGALAMFKRLWPSHFVEQIKNHPAVEIEDLNRFIVSTHTFAIATSLNRLLEKSAQPDALPADGLEKLEKLAGLIKDSDKGEEKELWSALPAKLAKSLSNSKLTEDQQRHIRQLPIRLDELKADKNDDASLEELEKLKKLEEAIKKQLGDRVETYYALILMDGDNMGAWISGEPLSDGTATSACYSRLWPGGAADSPLGQCRHPGSPARHLTISAALNHFSLHLARYVVEELCSGKLLYAGGDDVMAMVSIDDLLKAMLLLRLVYSGDWQGDWPTVLPQPEELNLHHGVATLNGKTYPLMGRKATASMGAVVAHHQAPLGMVLRQLRESEKRAKSHGRNAFSLSILKRAGGSLDLTSRWHRPDLTSDQPDQEHYQPMLQLLALRELFAKGHISRRAVYQLEEKLRNIPPCPASESGQGFTRGDYKALLAQQIGYQLLRQSSASGDSIRKERQKQGEQLTEMVMALCEASATGSPPANRPTPAELALNFLQVAEYLGREGRTEERPATDAATAQAQPQGIPA